ncbi:MAG: hypothetical protein EBU80_10010 [Chitinophagia bacterium]|nr:hypothetical protein [Chitinophagia bacterium]
MVSVLERSQTTLCFFSWENPNKTIKSKGRTSIHFFIRKVFNIQKLGNNTQKSIGDIRHNNSCK